MTTAIATTGQILRCGRKHTTKLDNDWRSLDAHWDAYGYMRCHCGAPVKMTQIQGRVTDTKCGARCTSATGPVCDCECGGNRHGEDHRS